MASPTPRRRRFNPLRWLARMMRPARHADGTPAAQLMWELRRERIVAERRRPALAPPVRKPSPTAKLRTPGGTLARLRFATVPATAPAVRVLKAARSAARESAAVAASTARRMGAQHRHIPGTTDVHHNMAVKLARYARRYEQGRAAGEMSPFARTRGEFAW